jgi:hypothetical protein
VIDICPEHSFVCNQIIKLIMPYKNSMSGHKRALSEADQYVKNQIGAEIRGVGCQRETASVYSSLEFHQRSSCVSSLSCHLDARARRSTTTHSRAQNTSPPPPPPAGRIEIKIEYAPMCQINGSCRPEE